MTDRNGYTVGVEVEKEGTINIHLFHNILHIECGGNYWAFEYAHPTFGPLVDPQGRIRGTLTHLFFTFRVRNIYRID